MLIDFINLKPNYNGICLVISNMGCYYLLSYLKSLPIIPYWYSKAINKQFDEMKQREHFVINYSQMNTSETLIPTQKWLIKTLSLESPSNEPTTTLSDVTEFTTLRWRRQNLPRQTRWTNQIHSSTLNPPLFTSLKQYTSEASRGGRSHDTNSADKGTCRFDGPEAQGEMAPRPVFISSGACLMESFSFSCCERFFTCYSVNKYTGRDLFPVEYIIYSI